jgi:glycogen debranching enzyme
MFTTKNRMPASNTPGIIVFNWLLYFILFLMFFFAINLFSRDKKISIGFLTDEKKPDKELEAAFSFIKNNSSYKAEKLSFAQISSKNLNKYDIIWYHKPDSSGNIPGQLGNERINSLKTYINNGGRLLLTLAAVNYLPDLGLEKTPPSFMHVPAIDEGYGRRLGLHAFLSHPVFNGLNGGAYIWNALEDNVTRQYGYFDDAIPQGKVIATDWWYIHLHENTKLMMEYNPGEGKVIAIGAYTFFAPGNRNRAHLEMFMNNTINYLVSNGHLENVNYWNFDPLTVSEVRNDDGTTAEFPPAQAWDINKSSMKYYSFYASEEFYDVAGERIVLMGKENGGIDEIWLHPYMALRDYEAGIRFSYRDTIFWFNDQRPEIEITPEAIIRTYRFPRGYVKEILTVDPARPAAVLHYEYRSLFEAELITKFKSNLRLMWPYSHKAAGSINYRWVPGNALVIQNVSKEFNTIIGSNKKPAYKLFGRYDGFDKKDSVFAGRQTDKLQAAGILTYGLKMNDNLDIVIAGTSEGEAKAWEFYNDAIKDPHSIYISSSAYYNKFLDDKTVISSNDTVFNEGYKWALAGTDKFFVNTPGIGKSLVAGYATTAKGWGGAQEVSGRPGYAWYFGRDGQWSGFALLDYGDFEKVKYILQCFNKYQDLSGKIFHELTTSGFVHYDAADATPLYIILAGKYLRHSGDLAFIKETWHHIKKAIDFCYSTDTDGDRLIENTNVGHGWVESGSLYGAHTTLYLAASWSAALTEAAYIAENIGLNAEAAEYKKEAKVVRDIIDKDFWNEKDTFFYYGKLRDGSFNPEQTALPAVPMYFGLVDDDKAAPVLNRYAHNGFSADWGVRIISEESPLFKPTGYHYGSIWPLFTGWISLAEYTHGRYNQGFSHFMGNLKDYKYGAKGYVEEVLNGIIYQPTGVCAHQCWSETMVLQPSLEGMLGLKPDALNNSLSLSLHFPADWDSVEVKHIRTGGHTVDFKILRKNSETKYLFNHNGSAPLKLSFNPAFPLGTDFESVKLNNAEIPVSRLRPAEDSQSLQFNFELAAGKNTELIINHSKGIAVLPVVNDPEPGDSSKGFRIISSGLTGNQYQVEVEGRSGTEDILKIYAPAQELTGIENGSLEDSKGDIKKIRVLFEPSQVKYQKKIIKISFK